MRCMPESNPEQGEHEQDMAGESLRYVTGESQESHPSTTRENCLGPFISWYTSQVLYQGMTRDHRTRSIVVEQPATGWNNCSRIHSNHIVVDCTRKHVCEHGKFNYGFPK